MSEKKSVREYVAEQALIWTTRVAFAALAALLIMLFTPWKNRAAAIWNSPEILTAIASKLDSLSMEVQKATGEDRVIHEASGLTYVTEPVYRGDQIILNMVARRTRLGAACTMVARTALFTDDTNIATPGNPKAAERQISTQDTPVRMILDVPPQIRPGRITVHLSLEFDCGGKRVFDTTRPAAFMLLEKRP